MNSTFYLAYRRLQDGQEWRKKNRGDNALRPAGYGARLIDCLIGLSLHETLTIVCWHRCPTPTTVTPQLMSLDGNVLNLTTTRELRRRLDCPQRLTVRDLMPCYITCSSFWKQSTLIYNKWADLSLYFGLKTGLTLVFRGTSTDFKVYSSLVLSPSQTHQSCTVGCCIFFFFFTLRTARETGR